MTGQTRLTKLSRSIAGERALVTGAASGMGRATALLFADEGARVAVLDITSDGVAGVVDEIHDAHGAEAAIGIVCDVADSRALDSAVQRTVDELGGIDILVNNAGIALPASCDMPDDDFELSWSRTLDVNLVSHVRLVRRCLPHLVKSHAPRIVNIASTEAIVATGGLSAYAATKAGVVGLTKSLAVELGEQGVTVNCICPGPIETGMTAGIPADAKATYARRRVPLRRYGDPEEVAHMTLNLCLPASSFVTGAIVTVDGGMTIRHT
jgi:3-oxoacyl-[acyl-carrier protein] reductase